MSTTTREATGKPRVARPHLARLSAAAVSLSLLVTGVSLPSAADAVLPQVGDLLYEGVIAKGAFLDARRIAVHQATGQVFVTDIKRDKVFKFSSSGTLLAQRGGLGSAAGLFNDPYGIAVDQEGYVYVADKNNHRIQKFTSSLGLVKTWGTKGSGINQVFSPVGIAVNGNGEILVAEYDNHRIHRFGPNGGHLGMFGSSGQGVGQLKNPSGVASTPLGEVLVADTGNNRLSLFSGGGNPLATYGKLGPELNQFNIPIDVAVEKSGAIYVADYGNKRIQKLDKQGVAQKGYLLSVGTGGLALDETLGRLYLTNGADLLAYRKATAPAFGQGPAATGAVGKAYSSVLTGSGFPKVTGFKLVGGQLPPGLTLADSKISGVPTQEGSYEFWLKVENGVQASVTKKFTITISPKPVVLAQVAPSITTTALASGKAGAWYSAKITKAGFPLPTVSVVGGALPTGLKLAGNYFSGYAIHGTPLKAGTFSVTLRAQNGVAPVADKKFTFAVAKASARVSAKFSTKYPKVARTNIRAKIKLSAPHTTGLSKTGKIRVYYGKKRVKTITVRSAHKGTVRVTLPKFKKKGKTRVTLRYLGNSQLKSAKRTIYVRVR